MESIETPSDLANKARWKINFIADRVKTLEIGQWTAIENLDSDNEQTKTEAVTSLAGIHAFLGDIWNQLDEVYDILATMDLCISEPTEAVR